MTDLRHVAQLLHEAGGQRGRRRDRHGDLAGSPHQRGRPGRRERGADATPRVGLPRPCRSSRSTAARASSSRSCCCPYVWDGYIHHDRRARVPRPGQRERAHHRRRLQRTGPQAAQAVGGIRGSGRGPPAALRRADQGAAPGGAVVGRPPGTASTPRWRACSSTATPTGIVAPEGAQGSAAGRRSRGCVQRARGSTCRSSASHGPSGHAGDASEPGQSTWRRRVSLARSTSAGGGCRTRASPARPTRQQAIGSEPEHPLIADEDAASAGMERRTVRPRTDATSPSGWAPCPGGPWSARCCTACSSAPSSTRRTSKTRCAAPWREELAWRNVDLGDLEQVVAGLCTAIESPLGPDVGERPPPRRAAPSPARRAGLRDPARRR